MPAFIAGLFVPVKVLNKDGGLCPRKQRYLLIKTEMEMCSPTQTQHPWETEATEYTIAVYHFYLCLADAF